MFAYSDVMDVSLQQSGCAHFVSEFNSRIVHCERAHRKLTQEHQKSPFSPWCGLLVIRFSDETTMQTNWTKLASALEKMRRDGTTVAATIELAVSDDKQRKDRIIGGGLIPRTDREEVYIKYACAETRMMSEQSGRVYYRHIPKF
jgi:hypothetical protein